MLLWRADVIGFRVAAQVEKLESSGADADTVATSRAIALERMQAEARAGLAAAEAAPGQGALDLEGAAKAGEKAAERPPKPVSKPIDWESFDPYAEMQRAVQAASDLLESPNEGTRMTASKQYVALLERWEKHQEDEDKAEELDAWIATLKAERAASA